MGLLEPHFPRIKKFDDHYYEIRETSENKNELQERGNYLVRKRSFMAGNVEDYRIVKKNNTYGLYVR